MQWLDCIKYKTLQQYGLESSDCSLLDVPACFTDIFERSREGGIWGSSPVNHATVWHQYVELRLAVITLFVEVLSIALLAGSCVWRAAWRSSFNMRNPPFSGPQAV